MLDLNSSQNKLYQLIYRTLVFVRLVDPHDSNLSLTNIALCIALYKLMVTPSASLVDVGALIAGMANFGFKKYINQNLGQAQDFTNKILKESEEISSEKDS